MSLAEPDFTDALSEVYLQEESGHSDDVVRLCTVALDSYMSYVRNSLAVFENTAPSDMPLLVPSKTLSRQLTDLYYLRGCAQAAKHLRETALRDLTKSIEIISSLEGLLKPEEYVARVMKRAEISTTLGNHVSALRDLNFCLHLTTKFRLSVRLRRACYYHLAVTCQALPYIEAAQRYFQKLLPVNQECPVVQLAYDLNCVILQISSYEELRDCIGSFSDGGITAEVTFDTIKKSIVDFIMRKAQQWVVCGEKPNHSSACPCRAKLLSTPKAESPSLWTEEEPGEFLYSTVPQVCNELLCVLTNGTYTSVVDFVHFSRSAELDMNMRMASLIVIDFGLNFYGTDTFKLQEQIVFREVQDRNTKQEDVEAPASPLMFRVQEIKQPTQCPHVPLETPPIPPKFRELISQLQCCGGLETHYNDIINCSQVSTSFSSPLPDILHKAVDESSWEAPKTDLEPAFSSHFSPRAQNYQTFQMVPDDSWTHSVLTIPQWSMEEACACYEIATPPAMLFSHTELSALHLALPLRCKDRTWTLMYSTRIHGTSYRTLLSNIQGVQNVLLVIQDEHNVKFGCLSTVGFEPKLSYRGTGETFVYTTNSLRDVEVFRWVHTNHHFIYVASTYFMVGGGGSCAIRVDQELIRGCTSACPTFHSPPLTKTAEFNILAVELWSLD